MTFNLAGFTGRRTEKVVLVDLNKNKEITEGFIEANTRVIVLRTPLTVGDPIELAYNPKQTGATFDSLSGKVRREKKEADEEDTSGKEAVADEAKEESAGKEDASVLKF